MTSASITYQKPGTQPPIYVAGTFSDPPWKAYEMDYTTDADGEHTFTKQVTAKPGSKIQYKFRVGAGDWWVLHQGMPTVTDDAGNTNHELEVQHPQGPTKTDQTPSVSEQKDRTGADSPKTVNLDDKDNRLAVDKIPDGLAKHILASHSGATTPMYANVTAHGASTPTYASVAAEVAYSAALLNTEKPETPVPDELAGEIGYRRLSSTPIVEVARTAAEVADTARDLDSAEPGSGFNILLDGEPRYGFSHSKHAFFDEDDMISNQPPLFAHEALGMYDDASNDVVEDHHRDSKVLEDEDIDQDDIDVNDPTLERFPSNREDIIDTVRKLETGLDADQPLFEGSPLSPLVGMSRRGTDDSVDFVLSPLPVSPVVSRSTRRLDVTRSPRGSMTSAHSSTASLQAIVEEPDPAEEGKVSSVVRLSTPRGRSPLRNSFQAPGSDEDEGVAMKTPSSSREENCKLLSPVDAGSPSSAPHPSLDSPESNDPKLPEHVDQVLINTAPQPQQPSTSNGDRTKSPRIVIEQPTSADETAGGVLGDTSTTAVDRGSNGSTTRLRKTVDGQAEPVNTRGSISSAAIPPEHEGGWFKAFFRLLFVDWIGGFISKLCGGRRKT